VGKNYYDQVKTAENFCQEAMKYVDLIIKCTNNTNPNISEYALLKNIRQYAMEIKNKLEMAVEE
jgi:ornithine cyclodeaminase/alanine dehydrogenase-like protein (mu-crystallin family)